MTIDNLRNADWDRMERDVITRIRLLRATCQGLESGESSDLIARDLIGPNVQLLATFCENVTIPSQPTGPR